MVYKLDISDRAEEDFDKIIKYLSENLDSPQAAASFSDKVEACYEHLENTPYIYAECYDSKLKNEGFRRAVIKNYILLFKIYEEQKSVWIYRFFHSMQDYANLI